MSPKKLNKILFIEDEEDIRVLVKIALEDIGGFTLKMCSSGREALAIAETFQPDLFLLDVVMPELDGPAALKALHKLPTIKNVPAIFMTASVQNSELIEYGKLGILGVIQKPFDPLILAETIQKYWSDYHE